MSLWRDQTAVASSRDILVFRTQGHARVSCNGALGVGAPASLRDALCRDCPAHLADARRVPQSTCVSRGRTVVRRSPVHLRLLRAFMARCALTSASHSRGSSARAFTRQRAPDPSRLSCLPLRARPQLAAVPRSRKCRPGITPDLRPMYAEASSRIPSTRPVVRVQDESPDAKNHAVAPMRLGYSIATSSRSDQPPSKWEVLPGESGRTYRVVGTACRLGRKTLGYPATLGLSP